MTDDTAQDDAALIAEAIGGHERAFSVLMRRHKEALYRFVRVYVGDASEAFDLVQETFVAAWTNLKRYDRARPFPAWLRGIALNKCRDWARRRRVRRFFFGAANLDVAGRNVAAPEPTADEVAESQQLARLEVAIAALPDALKAPLILAAIDGRSHKEAAAILGLSAKAVEVRVYRARQALKAALSLADDETPPI